MKKLSLLISFCFFITISLAQTCAISIDMLSWVCNDNGTPSDPSDDYYNVCFNASVLNGGTSGEYMVNTNGFPEGPFTYGKEECFNIPAYGAMLTLTLSDLDDPSCQTSQVIGPLLPCSDLCDIFIIEFLVECDDNETNSPNDDYYSICFNAGAVNSGSSGQYNVTMGGSVFGPFDYYVVDCFLLAADGSQVTAVISDVDDPSCQYSQQIGSYIELISNANEFCPVSDPSSACEKVCENTTVRYTAIENGSNGQMIEWNVIGAESWIINFNEIEVIWGEAGSGLVEALLEDSSCGNSGSSSICVEILETPDAAFKTMPETTNGVLEICQGQQVFFENTSSGAVYYEWNLGDGDLASVAAPEKTFNNAGSYEISLIAKNECLCADTTFLRVEVEASLSPFVDCVGTICGQETVTYTSDADCNEFFWTISANGTISDGGGINDDFVTIDWGNGPYGMIELSVSGCSGSYCLTPAMIQIPIMTGNAEIVGPELVCKGAAATYSIQAYSATYYNWSISSGEIINGQGSNTVSVIWNSPDNLPGMETISVNYENCYLECGGSDDLEVRIVDEFIVLGDAEICPEGNGEYEARSLQGGGMVNCDWSLTDESGTEIWSFANTTSVNVPYSAISGLYMIKATPVNSSDYCNDVEELITRVAEKPEEVDNIEGELSICPGETYQYKAISTIPDNGFTWYINNGGATSVREGNPITITWAASGPYEINVTQTDFSTFPCESNPITRTPVPVGLVSMTAPLSSCNEEVSVLSATQIDLGSYSWTITPSDMGSIITEEDQSTIEILWHKAGMATIDVGVCGIGDSKVIEIFSLPEPTASYTERLCKNETGQVGVTAAFAEYEWNDENGIQIATGANPDLYSGSYELVVTDDNGCTGNTIFTIETLPLPNIRISTPDNTGICTETNEPYPLLYALNSEEGFTYEWFHNNISVGNDNPLYQVTALGNYTVVVTDFNGCQSTSNKIRVFEFCEECNGPANEGTCNLDTCVSETGGVNFNLFETGICNEYAFVNSSFGVMPGTFFWDFGDPESGSENTSTDLNPNHTFNNAGFYTVILFGDVEDADNPGEYCSQYIAKTIEVPIVAKWSYDKACPGEGVNFSDLSSYLQGYSINSWSWDFGHPSSGAANNSNLQNPVHVYDDPGTYNVILTITEGSCISTLMQTIEIHPLPVVDILPPVINCAKTAISFETTSANYVTDWVWDFGDPLSAEANTSEIRSPSHIFEVQGTYSVNLSTTNVFGCSNSRSIQVEIEPNLNTGEISSSVPIPICEGETADLISPAGGILWEWSTGETSSTITVTEEDVYSLTLTDSFGCTYEPELFTVEVNPLPQSSIRVIELSEFGQILSAHYNNYTTCEGEDVIIEALEYDDMNYVWSNSIVGNLLEFTEDRGNQLDPGVYSFSVVITNTNTGCSNEIGPIEITIHANPDPVIISSNPSGYLCAGKNTELSVSNPETGVTYVWSNGEVGQSIFVELAGEYFVKATNQYGCSSTSDNVMVHTVPDLGFIPTGCLERCAPDSICLPTIPNIASYQWYFNDVPIPAPNGISPDFIAYESGTYHVVLTDIFGCEATSDGFELDLIDPKGDLEGQVYYDVNNDGILDGGDTLVPNVQIYLSDAGINIDSLITDANGEFIFDEIDSKEYDLVFDVNSIEKASAYESTINVTLLGCDDEESVIFLLYFDCTNIQVDQTFEICAGSTINYNGLTIGVDTSFEQTYQILGGCDSTENVVIKLLESPEDDIIEQVCFGGSMIVDNIEFFPGDTHVFVYTNAEGCDSTINFALEAYEDIEFDLVSNLLCPGETSGTIEIMNIYGGTGPYTYSLDGITFGNDPIYTGLSGGDHIVYVQDINNCTVENTIEVIIPAAFSIEMNAEISCPGETTGTLEILNTTGGTGPYTYSLDGITYGDDLVYSGLAAGNHVIYVLDSNACTMENNIEMIAPESFSIEIDSEELCPGETSGTIEIINVNGGTGSYTYSLDGNVFGNDLIYSGLSEGEHVVYVQDSNGCTFENNIEIIIPAAFGVETATEITCPGESNGAIEIMNTTGGTSPYSYSIDGSNFGNELIYTDLSAMDYTLYVRDANGCVFEEVITVDEYPALDFNLDVPILDCDKTEATIDLDIVSGDTYDIVWSDGSTEDFFTATRPGSYQVTLTNDCQSITKDFIVEVEDPTSNGIYIPNVFSPNGDKLNDQFILGLSPGTNIQVESFQVFDRWGNLVFVTKDQKVEWDGMYKDKMLQPRVYVYQIKASISYCHRENEEYFYQGDVTLMR